MATYQGTNGASSSGSDPGWGLYDDNIARMLTFLKTHSRASGWIFFKYESTYNILSSGYSSECSQEINNYIGMIKDW